MPAGQGNRRTHAAALLGRSEGRLRDRLAEDDLPMCRVVFCPSTSAPHQAKISSSALSIRRPLARTLVSLLCHEASCRKLLPALPV